MMRRPRAVETEVPEEWMREVRHGQAARMVPLEWSGEEGGKGEGMGFRNRRGKRGLKRWLG